jgi:hypothetical protein
MKHMVRALEPGARWNADRLLAIRCRPLKILNEVEMAIAEAEVLAERGVS